MRPAWLGSLVIVAVAAGALQAPAQSVRSVTVTRDGVITNKKEPDFSLTVTGSFHKESQDAEESALKRAQAELFTYLRKLSPSVEWKPDLEYIRKNLVKKREEDLQDFKDKDIGLMRQMVLHLEVSSRQSTEMLRLDREYRAKWRDEYRRLVAEFRMAGLAKVIGGLVAFLAGVAGYIRLDELTKGYYTNWLRLAAASFVAAASAGLWLLA
jgi:hypothetical protein